MRVPHPLDEAIIDVVLRSKESDDVGRVCHRGSERLPCALHEPRVLKRLRAIPGRLVFVGHCLNYREIRTQFTRETLWRVTNDRQAAAFCGPVWRERRNYRAASPLQYALQMCLIACSVAGISQEVKHGAVV